MADRFDRFDDDARRVMRWAQDEAERRGAVSIGCEHILLGLLNLPRSSGARVLASLVPGLADLRVALDLSLVDGEARPAEAQLDYGWSAKHALERAVAAAGRDTGSSIRSEHLLLALVQGSEATAAILHAFGATSEAVATSIAAFQQDEPPASSGRPRDPELIRDALAAAEVALRAEANGADPDLSEAERQAAARRAARLEQLLFGLPDEHAGAPSAEDSFASAGAASASNDEPAEPSISHEELALRPLIELRRAAEASNRFRRATALDNTIAALEPLALADASSEQRVRGFVQQMGTLQASNPLLDSAWEQTRVSEALTHLRAARLARIEHDDEWSVLALTQIIVALRSLPEDGDDGEGVAIPAVPPPHPPRAAAAGQRLDA